MAEVDKPVERPLVPCLPSLCSKSKGASEHDSRTCLLLKNPITSSCILQEDNCPLVLVSMCVVVPHDASISAHIYTSSVVFLCALQGLGEGVALPSMNNLIAAHVPKEAKARGLGMAFSGFHTGANSL